MVTPTSSGAPDIPDPFEQEKEAPESDVPNEIVSESLPIPEAEKELEDFDFTTIDTPSDVESAATELATETLQIDTPEKAVSDEIEAPEPQESAELEEAEAPDSEESEAIPESPEAEPPEELEPPDIEEVIELEEPEPAQIEEESASEDSQLATSETEEENSEFITIDEPAEADLTDAEFEEAEELEEEEPAETEDIEDEEEEDLNLIINALSDDYVDPNGQEFKKLIEEILPLDDTMHILPQERLDDAVHFFDIEHNVFYTQEPTRSIDLKPFKNVFLQLDLTEDEIDAIKIIHVPHNQWEALLHKLKNHN